MVEVLTQIDRWLRAGEDVATATLVAVRGSAPRAPGARLGATASGAMVGSVSAGCVEADVLESARRVLARQMPELVTYGISDEMGLAVGLSCGGEIDVWVEPVSEDPPWRATCEAAGRREAVVLARALAPEALRGRRMACVEGAPCVGGIDAALDAAVEAAARELFASGESRVLALQADDGTDVRVFLETLRPPRRLFIVGGNQTAIALCRIAKALGYHVTVVDPRTAFATAERFRDADALVHRWPGEVLEEAGLDRGCYVVDLAHDPKFDIPTLAVALRSGAGYVGALGSRKTQAKRAAALREAGVTDAELARLHGPIGLDLGGRAPEEIALSIAAEMQSVRYGRDPASLRDRAGSVGTPAPG